MNQHALVLFFALYLSVPAIGLEQTIATAPVPQLSTEPASTNRPGSLIPLYVGFATAQALDLHSSYLAIDAGGRERNPVSFVSQHPLATVGVKVGVTGRSDLGRRAHVEETAADERGRADSGGHRSTDRRRCPQLPGGGGAALAPAPRGPARCDRMGLRR